MSYNIEFVKIIKLDARMTPGDINYASTCDEPYHSSFILDHLEKSKNTNPNDLVELESFDWCGEHSGISFKVLIEDIVPLIKGEIQGIFIWEDGEWVGFKIKDGKYTEHQIKLELGEELK